MRIVEPALLVFVVLMGVDRPSPPIPGHAEWADLAMLVAAAALALSWLGRRPHWPLRPAVSVAAIGYAGWAALSAAVHQAGGWKALGIAELLCAAVVTAAVAADSERRDRLLRVWLWASAALAAFALAGAALAVAGVPSPLYDARGGDLNLPFRARGLCVTSNLLASQLLAPLVLLVADGRRLLGRRARQLVLVLVGLAFTVTLSRSWLAAAMAAVLGGMRGRRRIACAVALAIAMLASMRLDLYRDQDGTVTASTAPGLRWRLAASALRSAREHPLVGVGPDQEPAFVSWPRPGDPPAAMSSHSTPIDVAARLGWPALLLFTLLCALVLRDAIRAPADATQRALLCALGALLFEAIAIDIESFRHLWLLLGLVGAPPLSARYGYAALSAVKRPGASPPSV